MIYFFSIKNTEILIESVEYIFQTKISRTKRWGWINLIIAFSYNISLFSMKWFLSIFFFFSMMKTKIMSLAPDLMNNLVLSLFLINQLHLFLENYNQHICSFAIMLDPELYQLKTYCQLKFLNKKNFLCERESKKTSLPSFKYSNLKKGRTIVNWYFIVKKLSLKKK